MRLTGAGQLGVNLGTGVLPTANLHIKAGTATAGTGALKLNDGVLTTVPEAGLIELSTHYYVTDAAGTRIKIQNISDAAMTVLGNTSGTNSGDNAPNSTSLPILAITETSGITGFIDPDGIDVAYSHANRTITLTGDLTYYWRGVRKTLTSPWTSSAHTNTVGTWFLYSTDGTSFSWSNSTWDFSELQVSVVHYNTSAQTYALRETHGCMDYYTHEEMHNLFGTYRSSGGLLTAGTYAENTASDAANTPGFDAAIIRDEDLGTSIAAWTQGTYTTLYIASGNVATFDVTATLPFRSAGSYILVNNPTTGAETAGINNRYYNVYQILVPVTSDSDSQKFRIICLQPQATYTSLAAAQGEAVSGLKLGDFASNEWVFFARITYITASGDTNTGKCRIATGGVSYVIGGKQSNLSVSGLAPGNHNALSNLDWTNSGHIGTASKLAGFNELGASTEYAISEIVALTGHITSVANVASLGSFTLDQLNTAISDANVTQGKTSEALTYAIVGTSILAANTTGHNLAGVGYGTFLLNSTGYDNVAVGTLALRNNTTGGGNTAIGNQAGYANTTSFYLTAVGDAALQSTTGGDNTAIGAYAGYGNTTGVRNIIIGSHAGYYRDGSNTLLIDNQQRADAATELTSSIIYGIMDANYLNQRLYFNASVGIGNQDVGVFRLKVTGAAAITTSLDTPILNISNTNWGLSLTGNHLRVKGYDGIDFFGSNGTVSFGRFLSSSANLGLGTLTPNAKAKLDVSSTTQGVLLPRMTTAEKEAITSPPEGLEVYDLTLRKKCIYTGSAWETITSS